MEGTDAMASTKVQVGTLCPSKSGQTIRPADETQSGQFHDYPTVLVAKDDDGLDGLLVDRLRSKDYNVLEADDWQHLFDVIKTHSRLIPVLLVDVSMVARVPLLQAYRPELQIVFVKKPVDTDEVMATIRQLLGPPPSSIGPVSTPHQEQPEDVQDFVRRREIEKARFDRIRTTLDLYLTFVRGAETAYRFGYRESAERTFARAEDGYWDMLRLFSKASGLTSEIEKELQSKYSELRERLEEQKRVK
jgi:hypothetical protein